MPLTRRPHAHPTAVFEAADAIGVIEITGSETLVPLGTEVTNTDTQIFSLASNRATIRHNGAYDLAPLVAVGALDVTGSYGIEFYLKKNGVEVPNSKAYLTRGA